MIKYPCRPDQGWRAWAVNTVIPGGTLNVEVIGMLIGNFFKKTLKSTQILILNP